MTDTLTEREQIELEAAVLRRLLRHLDEHKEVQNIDLMTLAGFLPQLLGQMVRRGRERARA